MIAGEETGQKIEMMKVMVQVPLARMLKEKETCMTVLCIQSYTELAVRKHNGWSQRSTGVLVLLSCEALHRLEPCILTDPIHSDG